MTAMTITLHGHTPSGLIQWQTFTPRGATVLVVTRVAGVRQAFETILPVDVARRRYAEQVRRGFKRVG